MSRGGAPHEPRRGAGMSRGGLGFNTKRLTSRRFVCNPRTGGPLRTRRPTSAVAVRQHQPLKLIGGRSTSAPHVSADSRKRPSTVRGEDLRVGRVGPPQPDPHAAEVRRSGSTSGRPSATPPAPGAALRGDLESARWAWTCVEEVYVRTRTSPRQAAGMSRRGRRHEPRRGAA